MEHNAANLLDKISEQVKALANTQTVLGDEFTLGEFHCRPVIKVGTGFGSAAGTGKDPKSSTDGGGEGAAAGIGVTPVGFLVSRGGEISFIPSDKKTPLSSLIDQVPNLVEKFADMKKGDRKDDDKEEKKEKKEEKAKK
ncbi:MAG: spore germination protein GerW family protein [Bacteroidales bacterium]